MELMAIKYWNSVVNRDFEKKNCLTALITSEISQSE